MDKPPLHIHCLDEQPTYCPKYGVVADFVPIEVEEKEGVSTSTHKCNDCGYKFKVQIAEREPLECCSICDKDLFDGDDAAGVTLGGVFEDYGGFGSDSHNPWEYVFCRECYKSKFTEMMDRMKDVLMFLKLTEGGGEG